MKVLDGLPLLTLVWTNDRLLATTQKYYQGPFEHININKSSQAKSIMSTFTTMFISKRVRPWVRKSCFYWFCQLVQFSKKKKTILIINTKSEKPNQWEDGRNWRHVFPWRHGVNETNHRGACSAKWLTRIFQLQRNGYNFCIFHSRQISFLHSAWGIVTNYVSRIYDVRRNRATQLVE